MMGEQKWTSFCLEQNMAFDFSTPQSHAIKEGSNYCTGKVGVRVLHLDSSTDTMNVMMVGGSRVLCQLDSVMYYI